MIIETNSASETLALGEKLGKAAKPGQIYTLNGMIEDKKQNVWIAKGEEGVYRLDSNNQLTLYLSKDNGYVKSICEDSRGNIYVGSMRKGLFVYNKRHFLR